MIKLRTTAAACVSTLVLGSFAATAVPMAYADTAAPAPCAAQQARVDKATAKLAALTAKHAARAPKKNQKDKKAQVQRVAHAVARYDACMAAQTS